MANSTRRQSNEKVPRRSKPRRLGLVQTGGTIAAVKGPQGTDVTLEEVILGLLGSEAANYQIISRQPYRILSENTKPDNWKMCAQAIAELINDENVDGLVVTHGTDTMTYTAAALSFMLRPLPIPVVMTGSNLPSDDPDTDGRPNIIWSVRAATHEQAPREVSVMFGGGATAITAYYAGTENFQDHYGSARLDSILMRGTRARKVSAWPTYFKPADRRYAAFQSVHADILGAVAAGAKEIVFNPNILLNPASASQSTSRATVRANTDLDTRVLAFRVYPGFDPEVLIDLVVRRDLRGIVLEAYGDGTMPSAMDYSLLPAIREITERGACVCVTSSVLGPATTDVYAGSRDAANLGAVPLLDMSTECAIVKLMWVLAHTDNLAEASTMMQANLAGEIASQ